MLEKKLREAARADEQTREHIIRELAGSLDEILPAVLHYLQFGPKGGTERIAAEVIRAIGYPRNKSAIPVLIDRIGDLNAPSRKEVVQTLLGMDPEEVVPALLQTLLDQGQHVLYWGEVTNGICAMLADEKTSQEFALPCGSVIAYLLSQEGLKRASDLDFHYLLDVLKKIGKECAVYALPVLIILARQEEASELRGEAQKLIASFDTTSLESYKYVIHFPDSTEGP